MMEEISEKIDKKEDSVAEKETSTTPEECGQKRERD